MPPTQTGPPTRRLPRARAPRAGASPRLRFLLLVLFPGGTGLLLFPGYGQLETAEYFDYYQQAQLRAASPSLRDVTIEVTPLRDISLRSSLGRRLVLRGARNSTPCQPRPRMRLSVPLRRAAPERRPRAVAR